VLQTSQGKEGEGGGEGGGGVIVNREIMCLVIMSIRYPGFAENRGEKGRPVACAGTCSLYALHYPFYNREWGEGGKGGGFASGIDQSHCEMGRFVAEEGGGRKRGGGTSVA